MMHPRPATKPLEDQRVQFRLTHQGRILADKGRNRLIDLLLLLGVQQREPFLQKPSEGLFTSGPAEDEVDGRKPPSRLQARDQGRRAHPPPDEPRTSVPILASPHANPGDASPGAHRLIQLSPGTPIDLDHLCLWTTEVVMEWDRTPLMHDDPDGPVDSADPLRDFVNVAHGGRERDELNLPRAIDNDLLPPRASSLVSHVVTFVQH